jgi:glycosyltransferase involved in cell wall biosynthesis
MRIGVDARAAAEVQAGRGRYVRELIAAIERSGTDDDLRLYARQTTDIGEDWEIIGARDPFWHWQAARAASRDCDVFLSTNSYLTAWFTKVPTAVVVYDLVAFIEGAQVQARAGRIERATIKRAVRRADAFICISQATRDDLVEHFPETSGRTHVTPLAADPSFAKKRKGKDLGKPYVLAVGTLEPRKNLVRLIEAWGRLPQDTRDSHVLALVGPTGWDVDATLAAADARADDVRLLGFVDDEELAELYAGCACFAYPSLYEGFGLPVLEAMAAGAPVITSNVSSLPEVAGDGALLVDPLDVGAMADALQELLTSRRRARQLRTAARKRAASFSWDATAQQTLDVLRQIASPG